MKLWIDDVRPAPEGYKHCKTVDETKIHCCQYLRPNKELVIEEISLDHDSGDYFYFGGDYIEILNWLEKKSICDGWNILIKFHLHSQNPVGVANMRAIIERNGWTEIK
jgi:hypothetical protein